MHVVYICVEFRSEKTLYCTLHERDKISVQKRKKKTGLKFACILSFLYLSHASTYISEIWARYIALLHVHAHKILEFFKPYEIGRASCRERVSQLV